MVSGIFVLGLLSALVYKLIDFARQVAGAARGETTWNAPITQAAAWGAGVVVVLIAGAASFTSGVELPLGDSVSVTLGDVDVWSRVLIGLSLSSVASSWNGLLGAIDATRSTDKPALYEPDSVDFFGTADVEGEA